MKKEKIIHEQPDVNEGTTPTDTPKTPQEKPVEVVNTYAPPKEQPLLKEMTYVEREFYQKYGYEIKHGSEVAKSIHERMQKYVAAMNSKMIVENTAGGNNQNYLFTTIVKAFSQNDDSMFEAVDVLLLHIHDGRGDAFANNMVYRFMNYIGRDHDDILSFQHLLEIVLRIANPVTRPAYADDPVIKHAVSVADSRYRDVMYNLVRYLSAYGIG